MRQLNHLAHNTQLYNHKPKSKSGFTLVELSIVLVIIGLLIGGILVGQSMIETANIQKLARQIQQYDVMISNFQSKYNSLPGDSTLFNPPGNGDGLITSADGSIVYWDGEIANFWVHLQQAGMLNDGKTYSVSANLSSWGANALSFCGNTRNAPATVMKLTADTRLDGCVGFIPFSTSGKNYFELTADPVSSLGFYVLASNSCYEAQLIDSKIDDGARDTGSVTGVASHHALNNPLVFSPNQCNYGAKPGWGSTRTYSSVNNTANLRFEMLSQAGGQ